MYLITGAGGGTGSVSRRVVELLLECGEQVRAMVRRDDERAEQLRALGAQVVVGDLTRAGDIADAVNGARRVFFNMSVSPDYLEATAEVCAVCLERAQLDVIVNMSQMTVSQMTLTSTGESHQQRLHWLAEHVLDWSGLPVIHVRPTVFWTIHCSPSSLREPSASVGCWHCPSAPDGPHRSPPTMSPASLRRCCETPPTGSARSTS